MKPQLVKSDTSEDGLSLRLDKPAKRKSYLVPILIAAAVHVVVIGAVVVSLNGKQKAAPKPAETAAAEARTTAPALRTEPQPVEAPAPVAASPVESAAPPVTAPAPVTAAPVEKPAALKPVAKPVVKKAPAKPVKPAVSKKAAKVTNTKAAKAKAQAAQTKTVKARTVKAKAKPVAKPKPTPKKAAPVLDLDKLSKGH